MCKSILKKIEYRPHCGKTQLFVQNINFWIISFLASKFKFNIERIFHQNWIFGKKKWILPQCVPQSNRRSTFPFAVNFSLKSVMSLFYFFSRRQAQKFVDLWLSLFSHTFRQPWKSTLGILWLHRPFDPFGLQHSHQPQASLKLKKILLKFSFLDHEFILNQFKKWPNSVFLGVNNFETICFAFFFFTTNTHAKNRM